MEPRNENDIRTKVYNLLLEKITSGEWKSGDKIPSENQLKDELSVSRITIREALQKLVALNLIETRHGKGSYIKEFNMNDFLRLHFPINQITTDDIVNLLEYRKILEVGAIRLSIERARPGDTELLTQYTIMMGNSLTDYEAFAYYDALFHQKLMQMTGNPLIVNAAKSIREMTVKAIELTLSPKGAAEGVAIHTQLTHAIMQRDKELAEKMMRLMLDSIISDARHRDEENKAAL
ncbi:MAG: FadR family transcriptional regulator [Oscillospiraceae bacterium]|nr:FadR family transcriptional regulator [Oscillospiraceae bacterium]